MYKSALHLKEISELEMSLWKESRLLIHAIFARALKTAAAANARLLASLRAKQAAVLQISSAKRLTSNSVGNSGAVRLRAAFLCIGDFFCP